MEYGGIWWNAEAEFRCRSGRPLIHVSGQVLVLWSRVPSLRMAKRQTGDGPILLGEGAPNDE